MDKEVDVEDEGARVQLAARVGYDLAYLLKYKDFDVYYDQSASVDYVGRVVSNFHENEESDQYQGGWLDAYKRYGHLSDLDIAIAEKNTDKVVFLIKIIHPMSNHGRNNRTKSIIGETFGFLLGEKVTFQGKELDVGEWTTLFIIVFDNILREDLHHYIHEKIERVRPGLGTKNSRIKEIRIKTVLNLMEMHEWLRAIIDY